MSLWKFSACVEGWNRAHGEVKDEAPSGEELEAAIAASEEAERRRAGLVAVTGGRA